MIEKKFRPYTKDDLAESIRRLPDDASIDDAIERLLLLANIEASSKELSEGKGIPHEDVVREMAEWHD
jgi:hypothetical protein